MQQQNRNNDRILLYHGTTTKDAQSIIKNGVDVTYGRDNLDFGAGFYVTRDPKQALEWVMDRKKSVGQILVYSVNEKEFKNFYGLKFNGASKGWGKFVIANRKGEHIHMILLRGHTGPIPELKAR